jgi:hypothetical protein
LGNLLDLFLQKTTPLADQMERFGIGDLVVDNDIGHRKRLPMTF